MKQYDFIIVGAGASGLSLACHLVNSPLRDSSILIVDKSLEDHNNHVWAFWTKGPAPFDSITCRSWDRLLIANQRTKQVLKLDPYCYKMIRGADFYRFAHENLSHFPNVEFMQGRVENIEDGIKGASIYVDGRKYEGQWVFDSRFNLANFHPDPRSYCYLKMHFRGWEIETMDASFDPQTPTFLDFRAPQRDNMSFFYVLPFSDHHALVEFVACTTVGAQWSEAKSRAPLHRTEQENALQDYIRDILGIEHYDVISQEQGISPMTDFKFPRRLGLHIMSIGVPAGMLKPTTGYAFTRIQHDSAAIVRSLVERGQPFRVPPSVWGYRLYDSLMLRAMARHGSQISSLLAFLFKFGSTARILRFLDERGAPI